jgi:IS30 family transposase
MAERKTLCAVIMRLTEKYAVIAEGLEADIYFAYPYASWRRGNNESTNELIRLYFFQDCRLQCSE